MRLASIAVLAVAAALAAGLQPAGAVHNDRYCMRSDCSYHTMKQCLASAHGLCGCGNISTELVVRSPADGYTLLLSGVNDAISATLFDKLNYNFIRDIALVASLALPTSW